MVDKEKVIKGLETCGISGTREDCEGYGCPYFVYNDGVSDECQEHLFDDALALLKEPRVMTLEEAKNTYVVEYRSGKMREFGSALLGHQC